MIASKNWPFFELPLPKDESQKNQKNKDRMTDCRPLMGLTDRKRHSA